MHCFMNLSYWCAKGRQLSQAWTLRKSARRAGNRLGEAKKIGNVGAGQMRNIQGEYGSGWTISA
jgi:hypothetical protein